MTKLKRKLSDQDSTEKVVQEAPKRKRQKRLKGEEISRVFQTAEASDNYFTQVPSDLESFVGSFFFVKTKGTEGPPRKRHKRKVAWKSPRGWSKLSTAEGIFSSYRERQDGKFYYRRYYKVYGQDEEAERVDAFLVFGSED